MPALPATCHFREKWRLSLKTARFIVEPNKKHAEFSVAVGDQWQGKGIGETLLKRCLSIAKEYHIKKVWGVVLAENIQMLALGRKLGMRITKVPHANEYEMVLELGTSPKK